jgi:hypothetical protein
MGFLRNFLGSNFIAERDRNGNTTYFFDQNTSFNKNNDFLKLSFENHVLQTILSVRCKLFSQMRITHLDAKGNIIENSEFVKLLQTPNYFQSQEDFFYQLMWFQSATGTNLTYQKKAFSNSIPKALFNLIPTEIKLNDTEKINKFIYDKKEITDLNSKKICYKLDDKEFMLQLSDIIPFYDLANGITTNTFMSSPSRVSGIVNVLENINQNVNSKNMNLQMSQKYLATSDGNMNGVTPQMTEDDRNIIERILFRKSMHITKNKVDVKHLVSDFKRLYLDEMQSNDANSCLLAFEMSKDVLNYFSNGSSTYENQQQAMLSYIQNSIQVDANSTINSFSQQWGLFEKGEKLVASYDHLPIMQIVMNNKINTFSKYQDALQKAINAGTLDVGNAKKMSEAMALNLGL